MDEREFEELAQETLQDVEEALLELDEDEVEPELVGHVLTILFADGGRFILNTQPSLSQLWLAVTATGLRFDYDAENERWYDRVKELELYQALEQHLAEKLGHPVQLSR